MTELPRPPRVLHCTSEPYRFFGRDAELALLDRALCGEDPSVVALVGPGGQGKTAIVQHWLQTRAAPRRADGLFFWSFYRARDADLCLRELFAYAEGHPGGVRQPSSEALPDVSASYCVDHLLPRLRRERWALVLDGTEVAQHESGPWFGRFLHPELGRLLEELASAPLPGVVVLTTRFPLPTLQPRRHVAILALSTLDPASARALLASVGVRGADSELDSVAAAGGLHAKAVELLGTYLAHFAGGDAGRHRELPPLTPLPGASDEETHVARVLAAFHAALSPEARDVLALATAFRQPPEEARLLEYLASTPVQAVLHGTWGRSYVPFPQRPSGWLAACVQELVELRLLERVGQSGAVLLDAHPLVRRGFEGALGPAARSQGARARAGFLSGRPDRRPPASLEEARAEVELFHAYCDSGLWEEADAALGALDNPKHRFLAPVFERELLLRFFPTGDWRCPPLWSGFGRYRSLAIAFEMAGEFEESLALYRGGDAPLRGDALLALGRLQPLLERSQAAPPWQALWQAYRVHALCLAGRSAEAVAVAKALVPVDVYEWVHVFECLLRAGELGALDLGSVLYRPPHAAEHRWSALARRRMRADYLRVTSPTPAEGLGPEYAALVDTYDRAGLPYERALTRLGYARWLLAVRQVQAAHAVATAARELGSRGGMPVVEADGWEAVVAAAACLGDLAGREAAAREAARLRALAGYHGPGRP